MFLRTASMAVVVLAGSVVMSGGSALAQSKFCPTTSTGTNPSNGKQFIGSVKFSRFQAIAPIQA